MTEHSNPMMQRRREQAATGGVVMVGDHAVPTEIHAYCGWLNQQERRVGIWRVMERGGHKQVEFMTERASDGWLAERGITPPQIGRAA